MNTYARIIGYTSPLLILESAEAIPASLGGKHTESLVNELEEISASISPSMDKTEAYMKAMRVQTINLAIKGGVQPNYAEMVEKYGRIAVNARGGFFIPSDDDIIETWKAETAEGAVC